MKAKFNRCVKILLALNLIAIKLFGQPDSYHLNVVSNPIITNQIHFKTFGGLKNKITKAEVLIRFYIADNPGGEYRYGNSTPFSYTLNFTLNGLLSGSNVPGVFQAAPVSLILDQSNPQKVF